MHRTTKLCIIDVVQDSDSLDTPAIATLGTWYVAYSERLARIFYAETARGGMAILIHTAFAEAIHSLWIAKTHMSTSILNVKQVFDAYF